MTDTKTTQAKPKSTKQRIQSTPTGDAASFHVPGLAVEKSEKVAKLLQDRLVALLDLHLTLTHITGRDPRVSCPQIPTTLIEPATSATPRRADRHAGYEPVGTSASSSKPLVDILRPVRPYPGAHFEPTRSTSFFETTGRLYSRRARAPSLADLTSWSLEAVPVSFDPTCRPPAS